MPASFNPSNHLSIDQVLLPYIDNFLRTLLGSGLLILLTSCGTIAPPAVENSVWASLRTDLEELSQWQLSGRVNIRYDNESHTPRIRWLHDNRNYTIRLWGTFNAGNTRIEGRPGFVTLEQGDTVLTAASPEDIILEQLGYELPVSFLEFWIRGLPSPGSQADLSFNELNQLAELTQDGWTVSYPDPRQYGSISLPRRVDVSRPEDDVSLRFIGLNWTLDSARNLTSN